MQTPHALAEAATFASVANCYCREVDAGTALKQSRDGTVRDVLILTLDGGLAHLRVERRYRSACGPHHFGTVEIRRSGEETWRPIAPIAAALMLLDETYRRAHLADGDMARAQELELTARLMQSYEAIRSAVAAHASGPADLNPRRECFIPAEQSLIFGHWLHPTPKSRQGMTDWQAPVYAPEAGGRFQLAAFAVDRQLIREETARGESASVILAQMMGAAGDKVPRLGENDVLVPMHPLQAEALSLDPEVARMMASGLIRRLAPFGPAFKATSSVRTVYNGNLPFMLKFSLPIRITNALRINRLCEMKAGVAMARFFARTDFCARHPRLVVIDDPAYLTVALPGRDDSGFEVILRDNPFQFSAQQGVITVAALTADPLPGRSSRLKRLIEGLSLDCGAEPAQVARVWFDAYLDCALDPMLHLYDDYGVALEAHQQNTLIDISSGWPERCFFRDNQGYYLSSAYAASHRTLVPDAADIGSLLFDPAEIEDWFGYYLIVNQIFSVIGRLGRDGIVEEAELLRALAHRLHGLASTLTGAGRDFAKAMLERPTLASKANLLTRALDIDEFGSQEERTVFRPIANPIAAVQPYRMQEVRHALAS